MKSPSPQTIVLVSCAAHKRETPTRAGDLYTSPLFRKARAFAEAHGDRWYILSALHGLLEPERVIPPYNFTLAECSQREREQWAARVRDDLHRIVSPGSRIIILAGALYRAHLERDLPRSGYVVEVPMRGLGIGQQLRFLTATKALPLNRQSSDNRS